MVQSRDAAGIPQVDEKREKSHNDAGHDARNLFEVSPCASHWAFGFGR